MPYVTSVERIGIQKGLQQGREEGREEGRQEGLQEGLRDGLLKGIQTGLKLKFESAGLALLDQINKIRDVESLRAILETIETASELDDVRRAIG